MKIGFDVSQTAEDMAGCGFFSKQMISHILEQDKKNEYVLYPVFYGYRHPNYRHAYSSNDKNVKSLFLQLSWSQVNKLWDSARDKMELLDYPDIVHSNNFSFPLELNCKRIMTIYDMGYMDCPEFTTEENRIVCSNGAFEASIYADHIVTISEFSKKSFLKFFPHYPEDRVSVVYLGNRPTLNKVEDELIIKKVKNKFNLGESSFWLGVGTIEPRKNYSFLLEAYSEMVKNHNETRPLYIAGGKGWLENDIQEKIKKLGIADKTKFLGYVTDDELSVLYTNCHSFIYPSLYEGFGLPVLEAMSCGAPVITSNNSSLPEVVGDSGITIDPNKVSSLVEAMLKINNEQYRAELIRKSLARAEKFSWKFASQQMLDIYEKVMTSDKWHKGARS